MRVWSTRLLACVWSWLFVLVVACSGVVPGANQPPVANAGMDVVFVVNRDQVAVLDGSGSFDPDRDSLTYSWEIIDKPAKETGDIENKTSATAEVKPKTLGRWVVALTVNDGRFKSARDVVQLFVVGGPCSRDDECGNGVWCDGDERCGSGVCAPGAVRNCDDRNDCTSDTCNEVDRRCASTLVPRPGSEGLAVGSTCTDQLDNDCDGKTDALDEDCFKCEEDLQCNDGNPCTVDRCDGEINECRFLPAETQECDDGVFCNGPDRCQDRACVTIGSSPCANPCQDACSEDRRECLASPAEKPCPNDGDPFTCTKGQCDGSGNCIGIPDNASCVTQGQVCVPSCASAGSGCVVPPNPFEVNCGAVEDISGTAACVISPAEVSDPATCLDCAVELATKTLEDTDFTANGLTCDPEGWELVSGDLCSDEIGGGDWVECCDQFNSICRMENGTGVLRTDLKTNCPGSETKEWRLQKTFDTRGYRDLELCFWFSEKEATAAEWLLVYVADIDHLWPGDSAYQSSDGPRGSVDEVWFPVCVRLPAWANNNQFVMITFIAFSSADNKILKIKDVTLTGWPTQCPANVKRVLEEKFAGCSGTMPDGWNGWTVTGSPVCPGFAKCAQSIPGFDGGSVGALNSSFSMNRFVDASELDDGVTLCFNSGELKADNGESIQVEVFVESAWVPVWSQEKDMGWDGCAPVCINLSAHVPAVNNNPRLGIRFTLGSNNSDRTVAVTNIVLQGSVFCDAAGNVGVGAITADGSDFHFVVSNETSEDLSIRVRCVWDSIVPPVEASTTIDLLAKP